MVTHLLSTWETPDETHGPTARFSVWVPAETTCLGRKTPDRCMLHAATACSGAGQHFQGYDMEPRNQVQLNAAEIIGMDAHSRKLSLCLVRKEGERYIKVKSISTTLDALEATYLKQLPPGAQTVLEASTNSFDIVRRLAAIGREGRVLCSDVLSGLSRQDRVNDRIDAENLALTALRRGSDQRERAIDLEVWNSPGMTRLQQVQGVRSITAFALLAFVEDIHRFANPKKLVSYIGLNPYVNDSGDENSRRKVSPFGRADLKTLFIEAAQSAMQSDTPLTRWAKRLLARGKPWNAVMAAVARKLVAYCWHALMGHPLPSRESESRTARKLARLATRVGKDARTAAGHPTVADYVATTCSSLYGHLPQKAGKETKNPKKLPPAS